VISRERGRIRNSLRPRAAALPANISLSRRARRSNVTVMRSAFTAFFLLVVSVTVAHAAEVEFTRVWPAWRNAESFDRISEYFSGRENTSGHTLLRTHAEARAGYYFLVRLKNGATAPAGAKFVLNLITPDAPEAKTFTFPVGAATGGVFDLGLTGADWAEKKIHPVAWKLELLGADGHALAGAQSFLWALPAP
jgi:hypothetical protein